MRTAVRQTSIDAYHALGNQEGKQEFNVLAQIALRPDSTRREIAKALGMETSTVAARVNSLLQAGKVEEHGKRKCSISGMNVAALRVCPVQRSLFPGAA